MSLSREQLLGYLLGALEPHEQETVETELAHNPTLRAELAKLQAALGQLGLDDSPEPIEPPPGLAERTMAHVSAEGPVSDANVPLVSRARLTSAAAVAFLSGPRTYSWTDLVAVAAMVLATAALLFPAIAQNRYQAQLMACQDNLRQLGLALQSYSDSSPQRIFPQVAAQGNRSVAGIYAPTLVGHQLMVNPRILLCPSSAAAQQWLAQANRSPAKAPWEVPTLDQLDQAEGEMLIIYQQSMGGSYGYSLGYIQHGRLVPSANASRANFPLLADAPSTQSPDRRSRNHGQRGENMLYEDGHVRFMANYVGRPVALPDDPFLNRNGVPAAGLDAEDSVLGASNEGPFQVDPQSNWPRQ